MNVQCMDFRSDHSSLVEKKRVSIVIKIISIYKSWRFTEKFGVVVEVYDVKCLDPLVTIDVKQNTLGPNWQADSPQGTVLKVLAFTFFLKSTLHQRGLSEALRLLLQIKNLFLLWSCPEHSPLGHTERESEPNL